MATGAQVLIAGAGPTGLALALWLTRFDIPVRIIDKTEGPAPFSRALGVQARTLELYRQFDKSLAAEVVESGVKVPGVNFWVAGRKRAHAEFLSIGEGLSPFPFALTYAQDAHERLLIGRLASRGVEVERRTELLRFDQKGDHVRAVVKAPDGSEESSEVAYLAGCDGARSIVRQALGISFQGGTYSRLFYVADVTADGPPVDGELHVELDEADLLAIFPMKGKGRVRLVGTVREESAPKDRDLTFDDVSDRAIERLKLTVEKVNWFSTYLVHHRIAGRFATGRAFLLGDAAHIHSPVGAQGMNTGIGDAVNLAWKLAAVLKGDASDGLLETYEPERMAFARRLVGTTDRIFTMATKSGALARRVRTRVVPLVMPLLLRLHPFRRFLFRTVSQLAIQYRRSALSEGRAGEVFGGDRLPWVPAASGEDNFAPLATMTWQVHIYGEPVPGMTDVCGELKIAVHVFPWRREMMRAGLMRGATYLIRPDGHVALADPGLDPNRLRNYLAKRKLRV